MNDWIKTCAVTVFVMYLTDKIIDEFLDTMDDEHINLMLWWMTQYGG